MVMTLGRTHDHVYTMLVCRRLNGFETTERETRTLTNVFDLDVCVGSGEMRKYRLYTKGTRLCANTEIGAGHEHGHVQTSPCG